jgi:hypothetical protein
MMRKLQLLAKTVRSTYLLLTLHWKFKIGLSCPSYNQHKSANSIFLRITLIFPPKQTLPSKQYLQDFHVPHANYTSAHTILLNAISPTAIDKHKLHVTLTILLTSPPPLIFILKNFYSKIYNLPSLFIFIET